MVTIHEIKYYYRNQTIKQNKICIKIVIITSKDKIIV